MQLNTKQKQTLGKIIAVAGIFDIDPLWASAVAMTESSLGLNQVSPTGAKGVFQMTSIAMKDLLQEMGKSDDDLIDIFAGVAFLRLLLKRWGSEEEATKRYCDPNDRDFYLDRVRLYKEEFNEFFKGDKV